MKGDDLDYLPTQRLTTGFTLFLQLKGDARTETWTVNEPIHVSDQNRTVDRHILRISVTVRDFV